MFRLIFGPRKTPQEILRENLREIDRAIRTLERETKKLESQEKALISEVKKSAQKGNSNLTMIVAKDLIRTRGAIRKFFQLGAQLRAISMKIQMTSSDAKIMSTVDKLSSVVAMINKSTSPLAVQKALASFQKNSIELDLKGELISDAVSETLGEVDELGEEEEDAEKLIQKTLEEIGIKMSESLPTPEQNKEEVGNEDGSLEMRIGKLN